MEKVVNEKLNYLRILMRERSKISLLSLKIFLPLMYFASVQIQINAQIMDINKKNNRTEIATFGAGCFWCVEAIYSRLEGVIDVQSGYSGGSVKNPTYKEVCTGKTGHAEVCQIIFNPDVISYEQLLKVFWSVHDPTTPNRQGNDVGTQYRSVIFYHSEEQKKLAEEIREKLDREGIWKKPIVTTVDPFVAFYPAEDYHDDYFEKNPNQPYCSLVIAPKVEKFEKVFKDILKP
jgi:peptide-methionine (S)-S-oxide reductase